MPTLVGLHGPSGVGKDFTARHFEALRWQHLKLATGLRHLTYTLLNLPMTRSGDKDYEEELGLTKNLIEVGKQARDIHPEIFCQTLVWQIWHKPRALSCPGIVVSDVRQQNELATVLGMGGTVYEVQRSEVARPEQPLDNLLDRDKLPKLPSGHTQVTPKPMRPIEPPSSETLANLYALAGHTDPWGLLVHLAKP